MKYDRQTKIKHMFLEKKRLRCDEICREFGISVETVRRDLAALEKEGLIRRVYGGGILQDNTGAPNPIRPRAARIIRNSAEKVSIAEAIIPQIRDGMTIILDSGTTMLEVARLLYQRKDLKIITNDIHIAAELSLHTDHTVCLAGGTLKKDDLITVGFPAAEYIKNFVRIDAAVLTADGFNDGIWDFNADMADLKTVMVRKADKIIAGLDHTKFTIEALYKVCGMEELDLVVTGDEAPEKALRSLRRVAVAVTLVPCG